ncbi:MAG TPA: hypothetical protein VFN51_00790 [Candidatus Saccharimonadales bacterium]|nr:hypothetical protein [Candidatus Saccharimonadales bacterium]
MDSQSNDSQSSAPEPQSQNNPDPNLGRPLDSQLQSQPLPQPEGAKQPAPDQSQQQQTSETNAYAAPLPQKFDPSIPQEAMPPTLTSAQTPEDGFTWMAPEFVVHEKSSTWYLKLSIASLLVSGLLYLLTRDLITAGMVIVAGLFLGVYALRKPKNIVYNVNDEGITIGRRHFNYEQFRSFTVMPEGHLLTFTFLPLKRFEPPIGMCYADDKADSIITYISLRLPVEHRKPDLIDILMQLIRF